MDLTKKQKIQPLVGLGLLIATAAFAAYKSMVDQELALFLITGLMLGYILTRARFGFAGGIKRIYITGEGSLSTTLLVMFAISMVMAAGIQWAAARNGMDLPGLSSVKFLNITVMIGGFIFGIGMMLAGGCASGTLSDLGEGEGHALIGITTFILGSIPGVLVQDALNQTAIGKIGIQLYLPDVFGYTGSLAISFLLLLGLYVIVRKYEDFRRKEGFYQEVVYEEQELPRGEGEDFKLFSYNTFHRLFVQRWSFMLGGILLAIMFAFILITTGHSWGVTGPFTSWGIAFLQMFGLEFTAPVFEPFVWTANNGILNDALSLRNFGIVLGAMIAFLFAGRLSTKFNFSLRNVSYYLIGGFLMGFGARLGGGCNIGALFSGIGNFSIAGWGFFVAISLGGIVGLKLFAGKVDIIPPSRYSK